MTFEKEFPSLSKATKKLDIRGLIMENCLDKKKVLDAIEKLKETEWNVELTPEEYHVNYDDLKKELGLENTFLGMKIKADKSLKENEFRLE